jgi:hypothetical protein
LRHILTANRIDHYGWGEFWRDGYRVARLFFPREEKMTIDSRFVIMALTMTTVLAFGSSLALGQEKANRNIPTLDNLVKDGFEIKGMERGTARAPFVVLLQRGTEVKTCIMRIERRRQGTPSRESLCF